MADVDNTGIWQHWIQQLIQLTTGGGLGAGQQFSAGATTLSVDLANADAEISAETIYQLGNTIPAESPTYAPGGGLVTSYALFLDYVDLGGDVDPNLQSQINIAAGSLTSAQKNYNTLQNTAYTNFASYKKNVDQSANFDTWVAANDPTFLSAKAALVGAQSDYTKLMIQAHGPGYQSLAHARTAVGYDVGAQSITAPNSYNMKVKTGTVAPAGSGSTVLPGQDPAAPTDNLFESYRAAFQFDSSFTQKYQEWQQASVAGKKSAGGTISVGTIAQTLQWSDFGWDAAFNVDVLADFFSIGVSGSTSGEKYSIDTTSKSFQLSVDFVGLGSFSITPGNWWQGGSIVDTYHDKLTTGAPDFFGDSGSLARFPYQAVVGFEPTVTLVLDTQDYHDAKTTWEASTTVSVGIGPFKLGSATVNVNGGKEQMSFNDATGTITIGPIKSTVPILLGVISQRLPS